MSGPSVMPRFKERRFKSTPKARRRAKANRDYATWEAERMARHPLCTLCGEPATVLHHRRLRSQGGALISYANTVTACTECHSKIHADVAWARDHHLIVGSDDPDFALLGEPGLADL